MVDPINSALEAAHQKLSQLLAERAKIDKEIVDWKHVIDSLLAVSESDSGDPSDVELRGFVAEQLGTKALKFTDGVRMILRQNANRDIPISVPEIRVQLINLGFDFAKYNQPLVPIHNTLKRLEEQGEVVPLKNEQGQTLGYKWISPIERALNEETMYGLGAGRLNMSRFGGRYKSRFGGMTVKLAHQLTAERTRVSDSGKLPRPIGDAVHGPKKK